MHLQQTAMSTGELQEESPVFHSEKQELIDRTRITLGGGRRIKETRQHSLNMYKSVAKEKRIQHSDDQRDEK